MSEIQTCTHIKASETKLEDLSSHDLDDLKKKTLIRVESSLSEYRRQLELVDQIEHLQQDRCVHVWEKQMDSGPCPSRWYQCLKCYKIK